MLLVLDNNNCIVKYSLIGGLADDNVIEYDENELPEGFDVKFQPLFYKLENNKIIENPNYKEIEIPAVGPSATEQQLAALGYQQMQDSQEKQALIKQNAQMAYQIMQIQQQLGGQKA